MCFLSRCNASCLFGLAAAVVLAAGCTASQPRSSPAPAVQTDTFPAESIPYGDVDRRAFEDAGVRVRTTLGNRVSVEVAERDTLVWFENAETGRFTRAFLRRGNTIYVLARDGDYLRSSPSETVAYRLFMKAWHQADATGESVTTPSYATERE